MARTGLGTGRRAGLGAWLAVLALAAPARADEAALNWVRLPGADECIDAPRLARLVEARIGRPVLQAPARADLSIEAHVGPRPGGGFGVVVSVHDRSGERIGRRELHVVDGPCSQLDRPTSLIISLIIDPDAAGPGLMEANALSPDAQQLLAQLNLPSSDADELLASLDFAPVRAERDPLALPPRARQRRAASRPVRTGAAQGRQPPSRMVSVREDEWLRLRALQRTQGEPARPLSPLPGYALLGLAGVGAGVATYAVLRRSDLSDDPALTRYRMAVTDLTASDACIEAWEGKTYGLSVIDVNRTVEVCDEASLLLTVFWASSITSLVSGALGTVWVLWIADDDDPRRVPAAAASVSLAPWLSPSSAGAQLQLRL